MIPFVQPPWLGRAWEIWQRIAAISTDALGEERLTPRPLTPVERADVDRLVAELQRIVNSDDGDHRIQSI
jgi:hypothetical protein